MIRKAGEPRKYTTPSNLYWVTTPDHDEDCFIVASNIRSARAYHESYEGYNSGDAEAELLFHHIDIPSGPDCPPFHPRLDLLESLGGVKIKSGRREGKILLAGRCFPEHEPSFYRLEPKAYHTDAQGLRYLSFERGELQRFLNSGEQRGIAFDEEQVCGFFYPHIIREVLEESPNTELDILCSNE